MKITNSMFDVADKVFHGYNIIELLNTDEFNNFKVREKCILVEPFEIKAKTLFGFKRNMTEMPLIVGTVLQGLHNIDKGDKVIYNSDYSNFLFYKNVETDDFYMAIPYTQVLFKMEK